MDISQKTIGFLIDELITTRIKISVQENGDIDRLQILAERSLDLSNAIDRQLGLRNLGDAIERLIMADIDCFFEQERLFKCDKDGDKIGAGEAAMNVQHLNAMRNNWMRTIDSILGLGKYTVTDKTYK